MSHIRYNNLSDLARAMGISISQVYRVREGKRGINEKFIIGAKRAFPESRLDDLFYFRSERASPTLLGAASERYSRMISKLTTNNF